MRVLCAPNAFKGSLTAKEAAQAMARGVRRAGATPVILPVADGGDGTAEVLGGRRVRMIATGPYGERLPVEYRRKGSDAIVEVAQVGLARTKKRDPMVARSTGLGEMIRHAAQRGATRIIVALGGSATIDAGFGMLEGMVSPRSVPEIVAACDVSTRFLDAPRLFGPQKGATPEAIRKFEQFFAYCRDRFPGGARAARLPGSGAAGGIGWALALFHGAELRPGADLVLEEIRFHDALRHADLVLTGEGRWDATTREGKAPWAVVRAARRAGVPAVALCGTVVGPSRVARAIAPSEKAGMRNAADLLEQASFRAVRGFEGNR